MSKQRLSILNGKYDHKPPVYHTFSITNSSEGNEIRIYDIIESQRYWDDQQVCTPNDVLNQLDSMSGPATLRISSKGGDVEAGMRIYNRLLEYGAKTGNSLETVVDGYSYSTAGWIAMASPRDKRFINTGGLFLAHNPVLFNVFTSEADFDKNKQVWKEHRDSIQNIFIERTGIDKQELSNLMDADTPISAQRAVDMGFFSSVRTHVANLSVLNSFEVPESLRSHVLRYSKVSDDQELIDEYLIKQYKDRAHV